MVSAITVAPESLMRGYFRAPAGPGFALVGDACHFKHPGTAQGIADAVEQALYVADALSGSRPSLDGYERWRDERARALRVVVRLEPLPAAGVGGAVQELGGRRRSRSRSASRPGGRSVG
jgi:2-polyprenyl-6-methoxyphenol hydroxylase-like FAD-dependent oxidoreductase